eukprot:3215041-Heterocapsa_arctica.AAC.1
MKAIAWRTMMLNVTKVEHNNMNYLIQEGPRIMLNNGSAWFTSTTRMALPLTWHSEHWAPAMIERYATPQLRPTRHRGERQGVAG